MSLCFHPFIKSKDNKKNKNYDFGEKKRRKKSLKLQKNGNRIKNGNLQSE